MTNRLLSRFFCGCALTIAASSFAFAADMAIKAPPPGPVTPPVYNWSGFYFGVNGGYAWTEKCWFSINQNKDEACDHPDSIIAGGQIGFNWQTGAWVFGAEATGDWAGASSGHVTPLNANVVLQSRVDDFYTVAGRLGLAWNNVMIYGKGGGAWARDKYDEVAFGTLATLANETRSGWLGGAGVEYGLGPNMSAALEYDYLGFGTRTLQFTPTCCGFTGFPENIKQNIQIVTLRVNLRFNGF